ncbi:hypothetical protein [Catalinimonas niigatensis]|uniref:hypothetical protein n=1 Tax=Catalinimonas niigatensis TaxID=1397264 RepID=UPI002667162C|nr:hypothetical protein [Catalinimonas niigatensis]WPP53092.1 hypothetical protein PZB72_11965 [Catalinimonas niigatensis]
MLVISKRPLLNPFFDTPEYIYLSDWDFVHYFMIQPIVKFKALSALPANDKISQGLSDQ